MSGEGSEQVWGITHRFGFMPTRPSQRSFPMTTISGAVSGPLALSPSRCSPSTVPPD
jgi:hypothetical protein